MDRWGPPNIVMEELPPTESDEFAVLCNMTSGTGVLTGSEPQPALAEMVNVALLETSFVRLTWARRHDAHQNADEQLSRNLRE